MGVKKEYFKVSKFIHALKVAGAVISVVIVWGYFGFSIFYEHFEDWKYLIALSLLLSIAVFFSHKEKKERWLMAVGVFFVVLLGLWFLTQGNGCARKVVYAEDDYYSESLTN